MREGGFDAVREYYRALGPAFEEALQDMLVFDAVICNTDRHYGNFGFMIDNAANAIVAPAPLFDHGNALFNFAGKEYLCDAESLQRYADTLAPCVYRDFFDEARKHMTARSRESLRKLLTFRFRRHSRYNLPKSTLTLIEGQVQKRAKELLR